MANLLLRSPQYISVSSAASAKLTITIDGTLRYTIIKNAINSRVVFEISELCRDYIEHSFTQSNPSSTITIATQRFRYTEANGGGTETDLGTSTDTGYDGYGLFTGSVNPIIGSTGQAIQTNTDIYLPFNTTSYIPINYSTGTISVSTTDTIKQIGSPLVTFTIHRVCDSKFGSSKITFLNRFGALQEMYFFHKSTEDITTTSESYKRNIFDYANTNYSSTDHQMQKFNTNATKKTTLNTPFVAEQFNEAIEELMLSEYVWLTQGSITHPVTPSTKSLRFKTSVNDKLVQYTIEFDHTSSVINNVR
jgi:hypothetical protein